MAKRKTTALQRSYFGGGGSAPPARIVIATPRAATTRRKGGGKRRRSSGGGGFGGSGIGGIVVGAGALGLLEKSGMLKSLPKIPVLGTKGTVAVAAWFWAKHGGGQLARNLMLAAAALSAYQFGKEGSIDGDDDPM